MEEKNVLEKEEGGSVWSWAIVAGIVVIAGGAYFLMKDEPVPEKTEVVEENIQVQPETDVRNIKEFNLSAKPFEFSQKEIKVKKGDTVKINFIVEQGMHDWVLDEFNAKTKILKTGESDSVTFVADKAGVFEYYCSVANHRQMGMVGKLIVEE